MKDLLGKLRYKDQPRILVLNAEKGVVDQLMKENPGLVIDTAIDPRFPYELMLIFVKYMEDVDEMAPKAIHNLVADGHLWFAYPRRGNGKNGSDLDRDHGWGMLLDRGFDRVERILINDDWAALRFRNIRFIKSAKYR
ncbi:MAG TPA: hypothetical protein P5257_02615 [Bacteroidales bacterium]|nr:hypothetical protein [Bacteroidales bacterium]HRR93133.1 hypothetical protein [Bacteroidales bacterium]HRT88989.1 hypothetical protein [Bacteroidales bacterium]